MGCSFSKGCEVTLNGNNFYEIQRLLQDNGKNSKETGLKIFKDGKEQKLWVENDELKLDEGKIGYPFNFKINEDILCDLKEKREPSAPSESDITFEDKKTEENKGIGGPGSKGCEVILKFDNFYQIQRLLQDNGKNSKDNGLDIIFYLNQLDIPQETEITAEGKLWVEDEKEAIFFYDCKNQEAYTINKMGNKLSFASYVRYRDIDEFQFTINEDILCNFKKVTGGAYKKKKSKKSKKPKKKSKKPKKKSKKPKKKSKKSKKKSKK